MFMKSGKGRPPPALLYSVPSAGEALMYTEVSNSTADIFQSLIKAKQYRDDDSGLASHSK